jgi:hypothetical protein
MRNHINTIGVNEGGETTQGRAEKQAIKCVLLCYDVKTNTRSPITHSKHTNSTGGEQFPGTLNPVGIV